MNATATSGEPGRHSPIEAWYAIAAEGVRVRESMRGPVRLTQDATASRLVTLTELSWRRRFGVKGAAAETWLAEQGFSVPTPANSWSIAGGCLVARLATSEFLVEGVDQDQQRVAAAAAQSAARPAGVYPVPRQDLAVEVRGPALNDLLRQVCSVDFAPLLAAASDTAGPLVLTSMIGVGVVALPSGRGAAQQLTLWVEPSFAHYFWTTLLEVAADLGGGVLLDDSTGA